MGNRAVITIIEKKKYSVNDILNGVGIYLHWNGSQNSIRNFLLYAKMHEYYHDDSYALARLTQLIANFFGGSTSIGIDVVKHSDWTNMDNGVYVIGKNFEIREQMMFLEDWRNPLIHEVKSIREQFKQGLIKKEVIPFEGYNEEEDMTFLEEINSSQPVEEQLPIREMYNDLMKIYKKKNA